MVSGLKDMAREPEEMQNTAPLVEPDKYPYGLRITLTEAELEKLGVDHEDWSVGDTFHIHALAKVNSISENETENSENKCCVGLTLTHLAGPESEDEENKEEEHGDDLAEHGYRREKESEKHGQTEKYGYKRAQT
jgi:hypothetical protein